MKLNSPGLCAEISSARRSELAALVALKDACIARMRADGIEQWDEIYPDAAVIAADIEALTLHVLRLDGAVVGCLTLDTRLDPMWSGMDWGPVSGVVAAVHRVMVHPSRQGRGLAKQLMLYSEALARDKGWQAIRLDAFASNASALALYEGLGYRRTGTAMMRKGPFICFEKIL